METISRSLLTFLLNALWQIPLAAAVAWLACRLLRNAPAGHHHAVWVAALIASILLPAASIRRVPPADLVEFPPSLAAATVQETPGSPSTASVNSAPAPPSRTVSLAETTASVLLGAYLLFVLFRLATLAWASLRTVQVRQDADAGEIPLRLDRVRSRCQEALGVGEVELLVSPQLSGPVTAGGAIILPESLLAETSDDVLTTAIGHEMAHIARRDFASNLLYEVLLLPVGFHPAAWVIRRGIERTREMACDELVARRLMDARVYAESIVQIAAAMTAMRRPGYTLGVFDGDILEERVRRLISRPAANLQRARLMLAGGLAALAVCAIVASSLSFTARAQGAFSDMIKQGQAAYQREDYKTASGAFDAAVRLDPNDLEAKLMLAKALSMQFVAGADPTNPFLVAARKQYLDVLARDPSNKRAIHGMMILTSDSRQFSEAREWAQKAIATDSTDSSGYYTIGFLDWAVTYPEYSKARIAAGMRPESPGNIPDAGIRQNFRTEHQSQIDEGLHMLRTALEQRPDDSSAMAYMNLLLRIQAALADTQAESAALISQANDWVAKAMDAKRKNAQAERESGASPKSDAADQPLAPPPPPPPPPPPGQGAAAEAPSRIQVAERVQQAMILKQTPPVYPAAAQQAGVTGTVSLSIVIGKDGTVQFIQVLSGPPSLTQPSIDAVKQWVYQPTRLNGQPVEVSTSVNLTFGAQ